MTDPITPAEAAAAEAIDAEMAQHANTDLASLETPEERVVRLTAELELIKATKAHSQGIPHATPVVPKALPDIAPNLGSQGVVETAVAPSAKLAALQGEPPKKRKYAYQRNR